MIYSRWFRVDTMDEFIHEMRYAKDTWGCYPSLFLCATIRLFVQDRGHYPALDELVMHQYQPCTRECQHNVAMDEMVQIQMHSVLEYGTLITTCTQLNDFSMYRAIQGRYPRVEDDDVNEVIQTGMQHLLDWVRLYGYEEEAEEYEMVSFPLPRSLPDQCVFCQDALCAQQDVVTLPCCHVFHHMDECHGIRTWLAKRNMCPVCRAAA